MQTTYTKGSARFLLCKLLIILAPSFKLQDSPEQVVAREEQQKNSGRARLLGISSTGGTQRWTVCARCLAILRAKRNTLASRISYTGIAAACRPKRSGGRSAA